MHTTAPQHHRPPTPRRRAMALLLVLIAVGVGTVLAGVMLISRRPEPSIGANAARNGAANWAAFAAERYAEAVMETKADWITACTDDGVLMTSPSFAGGTVNVVLTAPDGSPPSEDDRELLMTVTATVGQMTVTKHRWVSRVTKKPADVAIDPMLSEFAIYARTRLDIADGSTLAISHASPEPRTIHPAKIGVGFTSLSNLTVQSNAKLKNAAIFFNNSASGSLKNESGRSCFATGAALPLDVPVVPEIEPAEFATQPVRSLAAAIYNVANSVTTLPPGRYDSIRVGNSAIVNLGGPATTPYYYRFNAFETRTSGVVTFQGDVRVLVSSTFFAQTSSAIEPVDASSRITFYTANDVTITNAGIGVPRAVARAASRDPATLTAHISPDRVRILALAGASADPAPDYLIDNSFVVASIHAPTSRAQLNTSAVLFGRITAGELRLNTGSTLFYDPTLDPRVGYTALDGPLYTDEGEPIPELLTALAAAPRTQGLKPFATAVLSDVNNVLDATLVGVTEVTDELVDDLLGGLLGGNNPAPDPVPAPEPTTAELSLRSDMRAATIPLASNASDFEDAP
ncbi:MAG: hypothetical protein SFZ24_00490 [Planctomycetota bacterium]|nr:hypothetical protein [Planctomycetota bacterium]